jgi:uncharacterized protein
MEFQTVRASQSFFTRYSTEGFIFGERTYQGSLLILPDELPMELAEAESDYVFSRIASGLDDQSQR